MANLNFFEEKASRPEQASIKNSRALKNCFGGDAEVHPHCRSFTNGEIERINSGVAQRGSAIRCFLLDHLSGQKTYLRSKLISAKAAKRIFERNPFPFRLHSSFAPSVQFFYGPDIIRDPKGEFRVLEDNVGYVGGFGDLDAYRRASAIIRGKSKILKGHDPFYTKMVSHFQKQSKQYGSNKILLLSYPRAHRANREDQRFSAILKDYGIEEITSTQKLLVRGERLFYKGERVSFLITNVVVENIEPFSSKKKVKFFTSSVPGFWAALKKGSFGISSHPVSECASDKEFYLYVEKMIRFYLKEKPILRNLVTYSLEGQRKRSEVLGTLDKWVIKSAVGQGGGKVWIGKNLSEKGAHDLKNRIDKNPSHFVAQVFTELSRLNGYSVDARPLCMISEEEAVVSDLPWGRGAFASKPQKVNLCAGGLFVISQKGNC